MLSISFSIVWDFSEQKNTVLLNNKKVLKSGFKVAFETQNSKLKIN